MPTTTKSGISDVVGITVGGQTLSGWENVRITRGIERCPSDFELTLTELYPDQAGKIVIQPSDPIQVKIGSDLILTGYVDTYGASIAPRHHQVTISGRSKVQDLVDCSASLPGYEVSNTTLFGLAQILTAPFGMGVVANDGDSDVVPSFAVTLTETPYEIMERVARWSNFLIYDDTAGNIVMAKLSDAKMASGFAEGQNVESASVQFAMHDRYTTIEPLFMSTACLGSGAPDMDGPSIPFIPNAAANDMGFSKRSDGQPRFRPLLVVSEQSQASPEAAKMRAQWDLARRFGRSQQLHLTVDSWRDSAGTLWQPNALATIDLPSLKLVKQTWLISEVSFKRGESGTTADLVLMPPAAFVPAPDILVPYDWQAAQDLPGGGEASFAPAAR